MFFAYALHLLGVKLKNGAKAQAEHLAPLHTDTNGTKRYKAKQNETKQRH